VKQALVLGGGGVVGIAWETGIVAGLLDGGVDLRRAEAIIGTSAGSIIGTRLAAGPDLRVAEARTRVPIPPLEGGPDMAVLAKVFGRWTTIEHVDDGFLREIGALAAQARTVAEDAWIAAAGGAAQVSEWPHDQLRLVAVDIESGALGVHDRASGAPLERAIAASCAIPGMFPPVTINGRRFMDGGVRSGTSADLLADDAPRHVVVIAPICAGTAGFGELAERCLDDEIERLRGRGCRVTRILPLDAEKAAFGPNLMDPERADPARAAGYERARALAGELTEYWQ
jgi:NTE family protein